MSNYKPFTKKKFEIELISACSSQKLGFFQEEKQVDTWEYVYTISTKNKSVDILIFSSVDIRTGKTREKGEDCVRLVLRWNTKYGYLYKRIGKHYRVENLFTNLVNTIQKVKDSVFNLNGKEFKKEVVA